MGALCLTLGLCQLKIKKRHCSQEAIVGEVERFSQVGNISELSWGTL